MSDSTPDPLRTPSYVQGLDEILGGGLPTGRVSLVVGGPGCGKSVLAAQFLAGGARHGEPGVLVTFEQSPKALARDFRGLDFDIEALQEEDLLRIVAVDLAGLPGQTTGDFTLDGLLLRLEDAIQEIGASRVAWDTLEAVLHELGEPRRLRKELKRLFRWLEERGVTTIVTAEAGQQGAELSRERMEEYVSDCVLLLDHRIRDELSTRRARVLKYRGGDHSGDEHPFIIGGPGLKLIPVTSSKLEHEVSHERVSSGIPSLNEMLGGDGFYRGSSVLISGSPGSGKSSLGAAFVDAACRRGEPALYLAFEESPDQIVRNMRSVGYDLQPWVDDGLLEIESRRPSQRGLEAHLFAVHEAVDRRKVKVAVLDPFTSLTIMEQSGPSRSMLIRLVDHLKGRGVTTLFTSLEDTGYTGETSNETTVSSLMDTWIVLEARWVGEARKRHGWVPKARGSDHSPHRHEMHVTDDGVVFRRPPGAPSRADS